MGMWLFLIYFFSALVLGGTIVGPLSIRVYATILLSFYLIYRWKSFKTNQFRLKYYPVGVYILFLAIILIIKSISQFVHPEIDETSAFIKNLLGWYFVGILGYFAVDKLIQSPKQIKIILIFILTLMVVNSVISWMQREKIPLGAEISFLLSDTNEIAVTLKYNLKNFRSAVPGIFGHGVTNGYINASYSMLALYVILKNNSIKKALGFLVLAICVVGTFAIEERAPMGLFVIFSLYALLKFRLKALFAISPIILIAGFFFIPDIIEWSGSESAGRYSKMTDFGEERYLLINNALQFISDNLLLGGENLYAKVYGIVPHNFILHSFVFGGIIGGVLIIYLFIYILKDIYIYLIKRQQLNISFFFGCGLAIYLLNGIVHSGSLLTGDVSIWLLYALMQRSRQLKI